METKELRDKLIEIITETPGVTLNGMFAHVKDDLQGKFPPMYNVIKELKNEGKIKIDGKKKNTGHYMAGIDIPDDVPKASTSVNVEGSNVTFQRPAKKATMRYALEKHENCVWKLIDENEIVEPINNLFRQCVRLVPLHYRVRDMQTGEILNERETSSKLSV